MKKVKINLTYKDILDMCEPSRTNDKADKCVLEHLDKLELEILPDSYYIDTEASIGFDSIYKCIEPVYINTYQPIVDHTLIEDELQYNDSGTSIINIDQLVCKTLELQLRGDDLPYCVSLRVKRSNGKYSAIGLIEKDLLKTDIQEV
jgi:hypothetical protein